MSKHDEMAQMHDLTMQTMANNRRSEARGKAAQLHGENLELQHRSKELEKENRDLRESIKAASSVVRSALINSDALRKTVAHLRNAWKEDSPTSQTRQKIDDAIDAYYNNCYDLNAADPYFRNLADQRVQDAMKRSQKRADDSLEEDVFDDPI